LLTPYFPPALVATRDALEQHPLANAILATVLANEAVNRCGPLKIASAARARGVKETEVICAWAQAWAALNLAPIFTTLDAYALKVPREVSKLVDRHTRSLLKAVIDGVLSVPEQQLRESTGVQELTMFFAQPEAARGLAPAVASAIPLQGLPAEFAQACEAVEAIESIADFLFAGLSVPRPAGMSLPQFLQLGMMLRRQAGIDDLERVLMRAPANAAQEPLRDHALQALRRTQQRLLTRVLQQAPVGGGQAGDTAKTVEALMAKLKLGARAARDAAPQDIEHAVLHVWTLSEAVASASDTV
jgi:glutamate dehydrogenase